MAKGRGSRSGPPSSAAAPKSKAGLSRSKGTSLKDGLFPASSAYDSGALEPSDEEKRLQDFKSRFRQAFVHEKHWRKKKALYSRFYDGDQLEDEEKKALEERGQPTVVINRIKPKIDSILGIERATQTMTKVFPRGETDDQKAQYLTEAMRYIEYQTKFDREESLAFEDAVIDGRGWYKHEVRFDDLEAELRTFRADNNDIFLDPYCKKEDLSDAKFLFESAWFDLEDACELFPEKDEELKALVEDQMLQMNSFDALIRQNRPDQYQQKGNDTAVDEEELANEENLYVDKPRKRVRLVTIWYKKPFRKKFMFHTATDVKDITEASSADLKKYEDMFPGYITFEEVHYDLNTATFTSHSILEEKQKVRKSGKFPFVLVPAYVTRDKNREPYGYVKQMVDPQKEINKRRSKMLHLLNAKQLRLEKGAVDNIDHTRLEAARPDGVIVTNQGFNFEIIAPGELAASQFQLLQEAKTEIDDAGINRELQGQGPNSQSGRAISLRTQQASLIVKPLFDNLRNARQRVGELWLEDIQAYWTTEKLIKITDDLGVSKEIVLNERQMDENGQEVVLNDVTLGKYDLIVEEVQDTVNLESDQFDTLVQLAQNHIPIPPDIIIEASSLPNKKELLDRLQQQQAEQQAQAQAQQVIAAHLQQQQQQQNQSSGSAPSSASGPASQGASA